MTPSGPRSRSTFALRLLAACLPIIVATACSTPPSSTDGAVPADAVIDATVLVGDDLGRRIRRDPGAWPVQFRPARAIILPDGVLRADVGADLRVDDRPGVARHLYRAQLEDLWRGLDELGFGDPVVGDYVGNLGRLVPADDEVIQILALQRGGRDWAIVRRFEIPPNTTADEAATLEDARMRAAIRRLAALAWAFDDPPSDAIEFPERYDFGPDPWARYRAPAKGDT